MPAGPDAEVTGTSIAAAHGGGGVEVQGGRNRHPPLRDDSGFRLPASGVREAGCRASAARYGPRPRLVP
jgi:hypothetical protein